MKIINYLSLIHLLFSYICYVLLISLCSLKAYTVFYFCIYVFSLPCSSLRLQFSSATLASLINMEVMGTLFGLFWYVFMSSLAILKVIYRSLTKTSSFFGDTPFSENYLSFSTLPGARVKRAHNIHPWDFLPFPSNDQRVEFLFILQVSFLFYILQAQKIHSSDNSSVFFKRLIFLVRASMPTARMLSFRDLDICSTLVSDFSMAIFV